MCDNFYISEEQQRVLHETCMARNGKGMHGAPIETGLLLRNLNEVTEVRQPYYLSLL